jgi:hypothetical protein
MGWPHILMAEIGEMFPSESCAECCAVGGVCLRRSCLDLALEHIRTNGQRSYRKSVMLAQKPPCALPIEFPKDRLFTRKRGWTGGCMMTAACGEQFC